MTSTQVWYIIGIVSSSPTDFHSEKIGLIRVTYDPPVSLRVNKYLKSHSLSLFLFFFSLSLSLSLSLFFLFSDLIVWSLTLKRSFILFFMFPVEMLCFNKRSRERLSMLGKKKQITIKYLVGWHQSWLDSNIESIKVLDSHF